MCRNIKTLHNFKPPATELEVRASSLQFVRKLSGFSRPSKANQVAFDRAVDSVTKAAHELLESLVTNAPPRSREVEASKLALGRRTGSVLTADPPASGNGEYRLRYGRRSALDVHTGAPSGMCTTHKEPVQRTPSRPSL
jgi:hypothetical protein